MLKLHSLPLFFLLLSLNVTGLGMVSAFTPAPIWAQTPSPAAESTTQKLKERIEKVVEEKRDQVKGVLDEITGKKRGFIGEVQRVSAESITLKTNKGTTILPLSESMKLSKKNRVIKYEDIAIGDWVIVIGGNADDDFVPEHIMVSATSLRPTPKTVMVGSVEAITKTELTVSPRSGAESQDFTLAKGTVYQDLEGTTAALKNFTTDIQVLVIGKQTTNGWEAVVVKSLAPLNTPSPSPKAKP
ncbi:MAG TPA: hypothetical protein VD999_00905 [Vitreimonas sp.]|nr:hypothetical protein [Vitreimonas sp.]